MEINEIKSIEDFKSFLLIYLAEADYRVTEEEKTFILSHVTLPKYESIKRIIDKISDYECLEIVDTYKNRFLPDLASRTAFIAEMEQLYAADSRHSVLERNMILGLKKILLN